MRIELAEITLDVEEFNNYIVRYYDADGLTDSVELESIQEVKQEMIEFLNTHLAA
jgi:hypothetical protein